MAISGNSAYATAADMTTRYDWRSLGRLLEDVQANGTPTLTSKAAVEGSTLLGELLREASGEVEYAAFVGARYSTGDLADLAGTNGGSRLAGLVCDLAMWRAFDRRPDRDGKMPQRCERALQLLERLAAGDTIFPIQKAADAGHLHSDSMTAADVAARNDRVYQQRRYLGRRSDEDAGRR